MRALVVVGVAATALLVLATSKRRKGVTVKNPRTSAAAHKQAAALAREAFESVVHQPPTPNELRMALAVSLHETTFGAGWKGEGAGSFNMGAIQANKSWMGDTFPGQDTSPTVAGGAVPYAQPFRRYSSALDGWIDFIRFLYLQSTKRRAAANTGDPRAMAQAMYDTKYYEGQGTPSQRVGNYEQALVNALWEIDHYGQAKS